MGVARVQGHAAWCLGVKRVWIAAARVCDTAGALVMCSCCCLLASKANVNCKGIVKGVSIRVSPEHGRAGAWLYRATLLVLLK